MNAPQRVGAPSVLMVVSSNERRGAEVFARQLADRLRPLGHDVTVVALARGTGDATLDVPVLGRSRWRPRALLRLAGLTRSHDVVVANGGTTLLPVTAACALTRRDFIYRNIGDPTAWGRVGFADLRIGAPLRRAAHVVALYEGARTELLRRYRLDPSRVSIVPNGVPSEAFTPPNNEQRVAARASLGLRQDLTWLGFVGALSEEKQPLAALAAVSADPSLGLVIAGDGPMRSACESAATQLGDRVRLLGQVDDTRPVFDAVSVLILPSRTEGIPGAAIEAGLCGLPTVATSVGGVPEVVLDGETGVLVGNTEADSLLHAVHLAVQKSELLGNEARRHCLANFSLDGVSGRWSSVLRRVSAR